MLVDTAAENHLTFSHKMIINRPASAGLRI